MEKIGKHSSSTIIPANSYQYIVSGKCTAGNSHKNAPHFLPNP